MIGRYDGAPDPLSPERLRELIRNCDWHIERLTVRGLHKYVPEYERQKRRFEERLRRQVERKETTVPLVRLPQITDEKWARTSAHGKENRG